ncbi:TetR family transcriptional regulator [Streptomyces venezuelae]|uniref:TetR family transcriptional regulator n=1 Tax=Streptomyces venezuelae TaxID=54571 RepID=A0A5P2D4M0_STRVZ|nr:TetR/AcrR family transcriptional regulator [Streptomyces venezuelae]QES48968.1 TetR family transcriptional regulator [Streptomyces venezuelae]
MGNREDLLAGARRCLEEKGYLRTTVRDIAAAAGVSSAAIGYHFGSREVLLDQALFAALDEWGAEVGSLTGVGDSAEERYADVWTRKVRSFTEQRWLWTASVEAFVHAQTSPALLAALAAGQRASRRQIAAQLRGVPESEVAEADVRGLGSVQMALLTGVMTQWLTDPEQAPSGRDLVAGLRGLADLLEGSGPQLGATDG